MNGIIYLEEFITNSDDLFIRLKNTVDWDSSMKSRKTASFGKAYNYNQMSYPYQKFIQELSEIIEKIATVIGFRANNCLINYYLDGSSKMGFHSDQTDILCDNTGVAIVSIGATRTLRFRNIADREIIKDYQLTSGSLIYMNNDIQDKWQHAVPKSKTDKGRMSLTFRKLR